MSSIGIRMNAAFSTDRHLLPPLKDKVIGIVVCALRVADAVQKEANRIVDVPWQDCQPGGGLIAAHFRHLFHNSFICSEPLNRRPQSGYGLNARADSAVANAVGSELCVSQVSERREKFSTVKVGVVA